MGKVTRFDTEKCFQVQKVNWQESEEESCDVQARGWVEVTGGKKRRKMPRKAKDETHEKKQSKNARGMDGETKDIAHYPLFSVGLTYTTTFRQLFG